MLQGYIENYLQKRSILDVESTKLKSVDTSYCQSPISKVKS